MAVPKQLKKAMEEGEALANRLNGSDPASPELSNESAAGEETLPATPATEAAPATDPITEDAPEATPVLTLEQRLAKVEAAYSTLRGKYDAELPRAMETVRQLTDENAQLRRQLAETPPAPAAEAPAGDQSVAFSPEERGTLGDDLADLLEAKNRQLLQALTSRNAEQVRQLEAEIDGLKQNRFYLDLTDAVKDWRRINVDVAFCQWLSEPDPFSGVIRHQLLTAAFKAFDVQRVANFFLTFQALHPGAAPAAAPAAPKSVVPARLAPSLSPQRSASGVAPGGQPKIWAASEMTRVRADINKGRIKGDEAKRLLKEIDDAVSAGRYRLD